MPCAIACVTSVHFLHSLFLLSPAVSCSKVTLLCRLLSTTTTSMLHASSFRRVSVLRVMQWPQVGPTVTSLHWMLIPPWTVGGFDHQMSSMAYSSSLHVNHIGLMVWTIIGLETLFTYLYIVRLLFPSVSKFSKRWLSMPYAINSVLWCVGVCVVIGVPFSNMHGLRRSEDRQNRMWIESQISRIIILKGLSFGICTIHRIVIAVYFAFLPLDTYHMITVHCL